MENLASLRVKFNLQLQEAQHGSICLLLNYLQTLKYEDSSLIEPHLFAFGPTANLPASNDPLGDIIRPVCVNLQHSSSRICRIKPSSPLMDGLWCQQKGPLLTKNGHFRVIHTEIQLVSSRRTKNANDW